MEKKAYKNTTVFLYSMFEFLGFQQCANLVFLIWHFRRSPGPPRYLHQGSRPGPVDYWEGLHHHLPADPLLYFLQLYTYGRYKSHRYLFLIHVLFFRIFNKTIVARLHVRHLLSFADVSIFHQKLAIFAISGNKESNWMLIHNMWLILLTVSKFLNVF